MVAELPKEPYGGPQLLGTKGIFSHVETRLGLAHTSIDYAGLDFNSLTRSTFARTHLPQGYNDRSRHVDALNLCGEAIELLDSIKEQSMEREILMGRCLTLKCYVHRKLGQRDEAYVAGEKALVIYLGHVAKGACYVSSCFSYTSHINTNW